jgi:hypothetical protein
MVWGEIVSADFQVSMINCLRIVAAYLCPMHHSVSHCFLPPATGKSALIFAMGQNQPEEPCPRLVRMIFGIRIRDQLVTEWHSPQRSQGAHSKSFVNKIDPSPTSPGIAREAAEVNDLVSRFAGLRKLRGRC